MIFLIGIGLVGSHLQFLMLVAKLCSAFLTAGGLTVFLTLAVLSGFAMLQIQTRLESYFIAKHIQKRPNSGWRVVARNSRPKAKLKSKRKPARKAAQPNLTPSQAGH